MERNGTIWSPPSNVDKVNLSCFDKFVIVLSWLNESQFFYIIGISAQIQYINKY